MCYDDGPLLMIAQVFPRLKQSSGASTIALLNDGHITNNSKVSLDLITSLSSP